MAIWLVMGALPSRGSDPRTRQSRRPARRLCCGAKAAAPASHAAAAGAAGAACRRTAGETAAAATASTDDGMPATATPLKSMLLSIAGTLLPSRHQSCVTRLKPNSRIAQPIFYLRFWLDLYELWRLADQLEYVRAVLLELARTDSGKRSQRGLVGRASTRRWRSGCCR